MNRWKFISDIFLHDSDQSCCIQKLLTMPFSVPLHPYSMNNRLKNISQCELLCSVLIYGDQINYLSSTSRKSSSHHSSYKSFDKLIILLHHYFKLFLIFFFVSLSFFTPIGLWDKLKVAYSLFIFRSNEFIPGDGDDSTWGDGDDITFRTSSCNASALLEKLFGNFLIPLRIGQTWSNLTFFVFFFLC